MLWRHTHEFNFVYISKYVDNGVKQGKDEGGEDDIINSKTETIGHFLPLRFAFTSSG